LVFEIAWKSGDRSWAPLSEVSHLTALKAYLEALDVPDPSKLPVRFADMQNVQVPLFGMSINSWEMRATDLMDPHPYSIRQLDEFAAYAALVIGGRITTANIVDPPPGYVA
jgi:hypothetical protein